MRQTPKHEAGMALVAGLFVTMAVLSLVSTYVLSSYGCYQSGVRESAHVEARLAAETGIQLAVTEIRDGVDLGLDGLGNLSFTGVNGQTVEVTALDLGGSMYRIEARALQRGARFGAGAIVHLRPSKSLGAKLPSAITTKAGVSLLGSVHVDGTSESEFLSNYLSVKDPSGEYYKYVDPITGEGIYEAQIDSDDYMGGTGTVVMPDEGDEGIPGVTSGGAVDVGGSAMVGGGDSEPSNPPPAGTVLQNYAWADGIDDDGDGVFDEEAYDGIDNDGDGLIDEDVNEFPQSPDAVIGLPPGSLKAMALAAGTYFNSAEALGSYLQANGGSVPGGIVLYADFELWQPADLGTGLNEAPSIIVHDWSGGTAVMKNVLGAFAGLILADELQHATGNFQLYGGMVSFAADLQKKALGTGNASILYDEDILQNLPTIEEDAHLVMWYRISGQ